jgi:hypothetical protein
MAFPKRGTTSTLAPLGVDWCIENPYRGNAQAVEIAQSRVNANRACCHGLEVVSGAIALELRRLPLDAGTDASFVACVRCGNSRNGATPMRSFEGMGSQ